MASVRDIEAQEQPLLPANNHCCQITLKDPPTAVCAISTALILGSYCILLALLLRCYQPVCVLFFLGAAITVIAAMGCLSLFIFIGINIFHCDTYCSYPVVSAIALIATTTFPMLYLYSILMQ